MTLKLLKIEAEDSWSAEVEPTVRQVSIPAPTPPPATLAPSGGVTARGLGALRRHGLLPVESGVEDGVDGNRAGGPSPDRGRALEKARELVDQAYAVPDGGWVEGGGLWTADRMDRRR